MRATEMSLRAAAGVVAALLTLLVTAETSDETFAYTSWYAARRSDYYLRRAAEALRFQAPAACARLAAAAREISPQNASVAARARELGYEGADAANGEASAEPTSLQLTGPRRWPATGTPPAPACAEAPAGAQVRDIFATPLGFVHLSELGLQDWQATLRLFGKAAKRRFKQMSKQGSRPFVDVNNQFFHNQEKDPRNAVRNPESWKELYGSNEYREWVDVAKGLCSSFVRKLGAPLSAEEEEDMELVIWSAVYPPRKGEDVTHYYHAHQESIVSFVLYVDVPSPTTPLTVSDPRGSPPIEDFEWFQKGGDLGVDGEPPFHRPAEFFAEAGDVFLFSSATIHKVPPHIGNGTRVVFPANCHLPKVRSKLGNTASPLDGWERLTRWPSASGARANAVSSYIAHASAVFKVAQRVDDPYMKMWELQNQVVAMLQFAPRDARAWIAAGNISSHAAVMLDARDEGEYYVDAIQCFAKALQLDPEIKPELDALLDTLIPAKIKKRYIGAYKTLKSWIKRVKSWGKSPPDLEVVQFLHPEINGPGNCQRMCPSREGVVKYEAMRILSVFPTRVMVMPLGTTDSASAHSALMRVAHVLLWGSRADEANEKADVVSPPSAAAAEAGRWRQRNESASFLAVLCKRPGEVWLADPRGSWPDRWAGTVPRGGLDNSLLGMEPKAPFHWHEVIRCSAGEAVIFPAWLLHQLDADLLAAGAETFAIIPAGTNGSASTTGAADAAKMAWQFPKPPLLCQQEKLGRRANSDEL